MKYPEFTSTEKEQLTKIGAEAVILFGSRAQGNAGSASDVDLGVLLADPGALSDRTKRNEVYDLLYDVFSSLSGRTAKRLCDIDIVFLQDPMVNLQLKYHVSKYGVPLFEQNRRAFADFKERTMIYYADFAPLRRMFNQSILARI